MRISAAQRIQNENRIRATMYRLLRGEIPLGGGCDITTLAAQADVDRTGFYGNRPYAHLRVEFEHRLQQLQHNGEIPDPKLAQIERLKAEIDKLRNRLTQADSVIEELTEFRTRGLARIAAQHEDIQQLRAAAAPNTSIIQLRPAQQKIIGPC